MWRAGWRGTKRPNALLTLAAVAGSCWLLAALTSHWQAVTSHRPAVTSHRPAATLTSGLYRGSPISGLWADHLPEQAWFPTGECRPLVTRFTRDHSLRVVRLASFPRSGNTWLRYLIEAASGLFTGAGGPDSRQYRGVVGSRPLTGDQLRQLARWGGGNWRLMALGFLGDPARWPQGNTITTKFHLAPEPWGSRAALAPLAPFAAHETRRAVLVVRDPFAALISMRRAFEARSPVDTGAAPGAGDAGHYAGEEWQEFVASYAQLWFDLNEAWLERTNETHVVAYERLTRQPLTELRAVLHFLGVSPDPARMECVRLHLDGPARNRRHDVLPSDAVYPLHMRVGIWKLIRVLNAKLKAGGHRELPLEQYAFAEDV